MAAGLGRVLALYRGSSRDVACPGGVDKDDLELKHPIEENLKS